MAQQQAMATLQGQVLSGNDRGFQIDMQDGTGPSWFNWSRYAEANARVSVPNGARVTAVVDSAGYLRRVRVDQAPPGQSGSSARRPVVPQPRVNPDIERRIQRQWAINAALEHAKVRVLSGGRQDSVLPSWEDLVNVAEWLIKWVNAPPAEVRRNSVTVQPHGPDVEYVDGWADSPADVDPFD